MTEDTATGLTESGKAPDLAPDNYLTSQRVFKKSSPNNELTLYLTSRELVAQGGAVQPLRGVLLADTEFVEHKRVYGQITLTFRYGREDEEVMGLRFCNEAVMCLAQLWPPKPAPTENPTPLQEALVKRLGKGAAPFTMQIGPQAPPSVQLVPAKRYHGAPIGTSYDVRAYVADKSDDKMHRRSTVRMGIRVIHRASFMTVPTPPLSPVTKPHKPESKLQRLSPKNFKITSKIGKNREVDRRDSISELRCTGSAPTCAVDKPFLLREGRVGLRASLDRGAYSHGDKVLVTVVVNNESRKTVRRIKVFAVQHVDVCMFSNGKFKNVVATAPMGAECPVAPGATLDHTYTLIPERGPTKNWIALEDTFNRNPDTAEGGGLACSVTRSNTNADERNVFAIYVSYYVKVKLTLSGMGGELCLKLPFSLGHPEIDEEDAKEHVKAIQNVHDEIEKDTSERKHSTHVIVRLCEEKSFEIHDNIGESADKSEVRIGKYDTAVETSSTKVQVLVHEGADGENEKTKNIEITETKVDIHVDVKNSESENPNMDLRYLKNNVKENDVNKIELEHDTQNVNNSVAYIQTKNSVSNLSKVDSVIVEEFQMDDDKQHKKCTNSYSDTNSVTNESKQLSHTVKNKTENGQSQSHVVADQHDSS